MNLEEFQNQLPAFLTSGEAETIKQELKRFPENFTYFHLGLTEPVIGQGDGIVVPKMPYYDSKGELKEVPNVKCIVLSNTCDISLSNSRKQPPRIVLCPIFSLNVLCSVYPANAIEAIRKQQNTAFFYIPNYEGKEEEYFVQYDRVFSVPRSWIEDKRENILFRFTQQGFYLFLMKLSINFCRFGEGPDLCRSVS